MLQHAFKEWAVICEVLAQGKQAIILRKGGIAEEEGEFRIDQTHFWLYPTYAHQQSDGICEDARPVLEQVQANRPPAGTLRLQFWAEVTGIYRMREELPALLLSHLHYWSEETVIKRFNYRVPELHLLVVRVHRMPKPYELLELPAYDGCRSWVELEKPLSTEGSAPVLSDADFRLVQKQVDMILSPSAFA
jgi:hypothetical protein